jgi:hypothetical protein
LIDLHADAKRRAHFRSTIGDSKREETTDGRR